jgi:N-acetylmuramoyl-L-alanine amidase
MRFYAALLAAGLILFPACAAKESSSAQLIESPEKNLIYVAYPKEGTKVTAASTFFVGAAAPDKTIQINGAPVRKNAQGFFAHVVPLKRGTNTFTVSAADKSLPEKTIHVVRPTPPATLSSSAMEIAEDSLEPKVDTGVSIGDLLILKVRGTPGASMSVKIDNKDIILSSAPEVRQARQKKAGGKSKGKGAPAKSPAPAAGKLATPEVNDGLASAYGKVFQSLPAGADDLYVGFYKIQPGDRFSSSRVKFTLKKDGKSTSAIAPGAVTVLTQPHIVQTTKDDTIVRVNPDKARLTPLPKGVRLLVDGWQGDNMRCLYGPGQHVYLKQEDVAFEKNAPGTSGPPPKSYVSAINISRSTYGDAVVVPLNQRLPFHIEQRLNPNRLLIKIYGATSDTDYASQQYKPAFEEGEEAPQSGSVSRNASDPGMVDGVTWRQASDDVYEVTVRVRGNKQWGFAGTYQGTNLVIHLKNPPAVGKNAGALSGLAICVDPGHGSPAPGSTGCSGVTEAQLNLAISLKLKKILEAEGAKVIMTRTTDNDLDLYDRCNIARNAGADVLLSVHNNALPDGRDPWKEHGSSAYFYHPQAEELARVLKDSLVHDVGFPDIGARYQNLALTRPSNQLSVLVEVGFMIHPDEYAQLIRPEVQDKVAQSLAGGLKRYFNPAAAN